LRCSNARERSGTEVYIEHGLDVFVGVPEPSTLTLLGLGLACAALLRLRTRGRRK
jgi:hypothetical protein